jgi:outer membrane protein assembly factor BamB
MIRIRARWIAAAATAALVLPFGVASGAGPNGDWPQTDHDASANRANTTEATITPANAGQLTWVRGLAAAPEGPYEALCGVGWTAPVIAGGRVYAAQSGRVVVHDLATGALVWQRRLAGANLEDLRQVHAVAGGRVFLREVFCSDSDPSGPVRAFDAATGAPLWATEMDGGLNGLAVSGDRVVAVGYGGGAGNTVLRVLSASTGAVVWGRDIEDCGIAAAPIVVYDQVYYQTCETGVARLAAARLADGVVAWTRSGGVPVRGDAVGSGAHHLYVGSTVVNPVNGATRFTLSGATRVHAVDATRVYATCGTVLCAFTRATGARLWTSSEPNTVEYGVAEPALAGALLYTPGGAVLDAATGAVVTRLWIDRNARGLSVGNGYAAAVVEQRILDLYSLPGR